MEAPRHRADAVTGTERPKLDFRTGHGPIGLIQCVKADGTPLVAGLEVTCFSDVEEEQVGQTEAVKPFSGSNEQGLAGKGGKYSKGDPWTSHVVVSGNLVTGQNPQSAEAFAQAVVKALA